MRCGDKMAGRPSYQRSRPQYAWLLKELEKDRATRKLSMLEKKIERVHNEITQNNDAIVRAQEWRNLLCDELLRLLRIQADEDDQMAKSA